MSTSTAIAERPAQQPVSAEAAFRGQLQKMDGQLKAALPSHIPLERFMRVVQTACNSNPDLLGADRRSLFESAMKAAQDGLLPDGKEGALVIYKTKNRDGTWAEKVQWMPMIGGLLKKIRNSGELKTINAHVVFENDHFHFVLGDEERIEHTPTLDEPGRPIAAYAIAQTKDGGIYRRVMSLAQIEKVRKASRAGERGPWASWWEAMAEKTVLRNLAKLLPMSSDLDDLIRRDDALYDFGADRTAPEPHHVPQATGQLIEAVAEPQLALEAPVEVVEAETVDATQIARQRGRDAYAQGLLQKAVPGEFRQTGRALEAEAWQSGWIEASNATTPRS